MLKENTVFLQSSISHNVAWDQVLQRGREFIRDVFVVYYRLLGWNFLKSMCDFSPVGRQEREEHCVPNN